ncbi:MAG: translational machinery protein [Herminiimonas sp.]|nr:translational machinery protein [Herminiimonas sp.]
MSFNHAVVWLDHAEALVLSFNSEAVESEKLKSHQKHSRHDKTGDSGAERQYFSDIAAALQDTLEILVAGPGEEKLIFSKHMKQYFPAIAAKIVAVETADHPTEPQLLAHARKYFQKTDIFR